MEYCSESPRTLSDASYTSCHDMGVNGVLQLTDSSDSSTDYQSVIYTSTLGTSSMPLQEYDVNSFHDKFTQDFIQHREKDVGLDSISTCPRQLTKKVSRTSRISRNVAEKQRRDKLNSCISKLASLVPLVSLSNKRINKSGILRLAASYLRLHSGLINSFTKQHLGTCLPFLDRELSQLLLEMTEGFAVITNESLKVIFVSDLVESFLRHSVVDVLGQSFYSLIHPDDHSLLEEKILSAEIEKDKDNFSLYCSMIEGNNDGRCRTNCKLMRIVGHRKSFTIGDSKPDSVGQIYIFIVKLCLVQPRNTISWTTNTNEITFRSAFTGRCLFVDHKLSLLLGIMPLEIEGSSGYDWICKEDHPLAAVVHTQMLAEGFYRGIPIRLLTKNKQTIYFMTAGKLVSSTEGGPVDLMYMVCTMISNDEGERIQALVRHRFANQLGAYAPQDFDANLATDDVNEKVNEDESVTVAQTVKRPRGRPRKYPINPNSAVKPRRLNGLTRVTSHIP